MSKKNGKKKKRIIYVDDDRTIADMSGVGRAKKDARQNEPVHLRSTFKDRKQTYFQAVRMMFVPMLVTIGIICAAFGIMYLLAALT